MARESAARPLIVVALVLSATAVVLAALAGLRAAPDRRMLDPRRSVAITGPWGSSGLAEALEALRIPVERRRRSLFGLAAESTEVDRDSWLLLLDFAPVTFSPALGSVRTGAAPPSDVEVREVARYIERGGAVLSAGETGVERCFGLRLETVRDPWDEQEGRPVVIPRGFDSLPAPRVVLVPDTAERRRSRFVRTSDEESCAVRGGASRDELLATRDGAPVAVRFTTESGGRAVVLADSRYVTNREMRTTDAGVLVLSWLLDEGPARVVVDEYHQGFGTGGSIFAAAWRWSVHSPAGWAMLQLAFAGLLALAAAAVRFGPALRVVERRRRSPMEHLEALAVGLERGQGKEISVQRIAEGLRRRLSRAGGTLRRGGGNLDAWLGSLALATERPEARRAVEQLRRLVREPGGHADVLAAALAVEDVWEALRPSTRPGRS